MGVEDAIEYARGCSIGEDKPELIFLHVLYFKSRIPMEEKGRLRELKEKKVKKEFETIKEMCEEEGVSDIRTFIKEGKQDEEIVETAEEEGVDLIVMGSGKLHDRSAKGRFQKFMYGSVTESVLHEAPCSVLVARPKSE